MPIRKVVCAVRKVARIVRVRFELKVVYKEGEEVK